MANARLESYSSGMSEHMLTIPEFHGIDQSRGVYSPDVCSSPDASNFIARFGELRSTMGNMPFEEALPEEGAVDAAPIRSRIFQAYLIDGKQQPYSRLVAIHKCGVYVLGDEGAWSNIGTIAQGECDALNYRKGTDDGYEDWFLLTDGDGNLWRWNGYGRLTHIQINQGLQPDGVMPYEINFQQIALLYERLWGAVTKDNPDRVYWSQTFDPENWELNYDVENDSGGFVDIPTFDGSRIRSIIPAFDDVLIFKDKSIHALNGTYPGEFSLKQCYGTEGCIAPRTIVYTGTMLYFLSTDGLCRYDGMSAVSLMAAGDRKLKDIWARLNMQSMDRACATIYKNVLYLAVPLDEDTRNSIVVEYHLLDGTYSIVDMKEVDDLFVRREGQTETLLMICGNQLYRYGAGTTIYGEPINARWISPEITCGTVTSKKSTGRIYMAVESQSLDVNAQSAVRITMFSGSKVRSKVIPLHSGVNYLRKRVKVRGRSFRFQIENVNGNPLVVHKGMEIYLENDAD